MASTVTIDLRNVGRGLEISLPQIQRVVELLDDGNTVPFITRYRKDQTGGLDEQQIREIQSRLTKLRLLAERKQTILRSIEAQGKLTEKLAKQIQSATTTKRLEDLYLPFKPKKQTLATLARSRGLEELAIEIYEAAPAANDLDARARDFANPDRQVPTAADALLGAGHILAEMFSERADLRQRLREIMQRTGRIVSTPVDAELAAAADNQPAATPAEAASETKPTVADASAPAGETLAEPVPHETAAEPAPHECTPHAPREVTENANPAATEHHAERDEYTGETAAEPVPHSSTPHAPREVAETVDPAATVHHTERDEHTGEAPVTEVAVSEAVVEEPPAHTLAEPVPHETAAEPAPHSSTPHAPREVAETVDPAVAAHDAASDEHAVAPVTVEAAPPAAPQPVRRSKEKEKAKAAKLTKKELKKKRMEERRITAYRDYFNYSEDLKKIPPHRVLAINRGERAKVLRVKIEVDMQAMWDAFNDLLIPPEHPHLIYIRGCGRDALSRLIMPALERDVRRELADHAELHAVEVFAKNLRNLLLQPPVHNRRVLAVDPGFKSGCKLAALDQFGNILGHDVMYLIGKPERRAEAKQKVVELVNRFELTVIAIGNGTAGRETEDFVAELVANELEGRGVAYVVVNEAGASVYSTSQIGREEFPEYDATLRGAISIGRRLQDPLSELVKIDPANIGVGLYQHDVKAKHLRTSLDDVVESCVNYVGVDVNTASPALLRYVSGLNQLTARRVYEYRRENGPFRNREQLRKVPGLGEATFVQAAGFLKIARGDNPLDATWIHPESYAVASRVLERLGSTADTLTEKDGTQSLANRLTGLNMDALAKELEAGALTLKDILAQLARPGRDPREDLPPPLFHQGVLKIEDLTPGMELSGTVLNVVDFGCFVDIGMHDSGLVHVSRMADRFIRDPHEVVAVGEIVKVWVKDVDKERRRVSLTMVRPGSERTRGPRHDGDAAQPPTREGAPPQQGAPRQGAPRQGQPPRQGAPRQGPPRGKPGDGGRGRPQGRGGDRGHGPARGPARPFVQPKPQPKPVVPITEGMKIGKEPMRTFGDLIQFFQVKQGGAEAAKPAKVAAPAKAAKQPAAAKPPETPPAEAVVELPVPPQAAAQTAPPVEQTAPPPQSPPSADVPPADGV
jgi:protein Tex